jgi:hypothetical protein
MDHNTDAQGTSILRTAREQITELSSSEAWIEAMRGGDGRKKTRPGEGAG